MRRRLRAVAKPLAADSVLMLIGDLPPPGDTSGWLRTLGDRIALAASSGVDTVVLVCDTRNIEGSYTPLDALIEQAGQAGLGVMPRIIVDSASFTERIRVTQPFVETLPAYANAGQLERAIEILKDTIVHLEASANVVAYQVEWGHFGESWINAPIWDSPSSVAAFLSTLHQRSPDFASFSQSTYANWAFGQVMYHGACVAAGDVRADARAVAEFYWYQEWRNSTTREITWRLRQAAGEITRRPIVGFSYVVGGPDGVIGHAYSAGRALDAAFSDWTPTPGTAHQDFIRDAAFGGLHLVELDFDTPYYTLDRANEAIANLFGRDIVPVIFYPHWSSALHDADIPGLVRSIKKHQHAGRASAEVLVVLGDGDIGIIGPTDVGLVSEGGSAVTADTPPGLLAFMLQSGVALEVAAANAYTAELGGHYKVVVVGVPRDTLDHSLQGAFSATKATVIVAHPSFLVGTPTTAAPTTTSSAFCANWNPLLLAGRPLAVRVWGQELFPTTAPPRITFLGPLADLPNIPAYVPNRRVFSFYQGAFDQVYATADFAGTVHPAIARAGNVILFGLAINLFDAAQRQACQQAFARLLSDAGVRTVAAGKP